MLVMLPVSLCLKIYVYLSVGKVKLIIPILINVKTAKLTVCFALKLITAISVDKVHLLLILVHVIL